jgi:hypothetical protein
MITPAFNPAAASAGALDAALTAAPAGARAARLPSSYALVGPDVVQGAAAPLAGHPFALKEASPSASAMRSAVRRDGTGYAAAAAQASGTGAAKSTSTASTAATAVAKGPLDFLSDSKLSIEEKLFLFMMYAADKYEKALDKKLKEVAGKTGTSSSTSASSAAAPKKKTGLLGTILGAVKKLFPAVGIPLELLKNETFQNLIKQIGGPVLAAGAAALGLPQLAPLLANAGPAIANALGGLAKALDEDGVATSAKATSSASSKSAAAKDPEISQKDLLEIQRLQEKQREMFSTVTNILRAMHDTKMAVIQNVRS